MPDQTHAKPSDQHRGKCCQDFECDSGVKNRYFPDKHMTAESHTVEQEYGVERRRLLNRAIHGWGLVYGFNITGDSGGIKIGAGLALDACGRELFRANDGLVKLKDLILIGDDGQPVKANDWFEKLDPNQCLLLEAHYAEQYIDPVRVNDRCHCDRVEWFYACETVRFSLRVINCDKCCGSSACELHCKCKQTSRCDSKDAISVRGGHCLCEYLTNLRLEAHCDCLTEIEDECAVVKVDVHNAVPLACLNVTGNDKNCPTLTVHELCGPRRFVKRNDVLYDLIRGCDLTQISAIGWEDWHRKEAPLDEFRAAFGTPTNGAEGCEATRFWVEFSRPVRAETVRADCFAMTVLVREREGGWWETYRVPIIDVKLTNGTRTTIVTSANWVKDAVNGAFTRFQREEVRVEIEVRGDFILDCNGQSVDANAVGNRAFPTGNGTPGGTFLSTILVHPTDKPKN